MRFFTAALFTETNTFAPLPTTRHSFELAGILHGPQCTNARGMHAGMAQWMRAVIEADGHEAVQSLFAFAEPGGRTLTAVYEELRDGILEDLRAALPVDAVMLWLHGAMVAVDYDDCEGDLLERVRAMVGPDVPVGAALDPHCHLTQWMMRSATALVMMKEYPHTDGAECTSKLFRLLRDIRLGRMKPVSAMFDCRMVCLYPTTQEPMASFVRRMAELERLPGVLSVSLAHGFPWGDVAETGTRVLVIADEDAELAVRSARQLGMEFYEMRERLRCSPLAVDDALDIVLATQGLVVLADVEDNPGGGAPGDCMVIVRRMLERKIAPAAIGLIYDPGAVQLCFGAGVGTALTLRVGGKTARTSGAPLDVCGRVEVLSEALTQRFFGDLAQPMGRCATFETQGIRIVLCSERAQTFSRHAFADMGIALQDQRCVVVKSSHHFEGSFAPIAARVVRVSGDGCLSMNFAKIAYEKRSEVYWPRIEEPLVTAPSAVSRVAQGD